MAKTIMNRRKLAIEQEPIAGESEAYILREQPIGYGNA